MVATENKATDSAQYAAARVDEFEKRSAAVETSLRDTAKWIIGGIAVAAGGIIAGTSLSSLGALGFNGRFFAAIGCAVVAYGMLGFLFVSALAVIAPRDHTLQEIAEGADLPKGWRGRIENKIQPLLPRGIATLQDFNDFAAQPVDPHGRPLTGEPLVVFNMVRRLVGARATSAERELQFRRLQRLAFALTPLIAVACIGFSVAVNPPKQELRKVPAVEKAVDVHQADAAMLRTALGNAACVGPKLQVVVLGEWPSGVQDVVTVPSASCPPLRLRLDQGRFSQVQSAS